MQPKVAIVTGASSGIGQATAAELARRGYAVVLAARRAERLAQVACQCDAAARAAYAPRVPPAPPALAVPTDVCIEEQVQALVDRAVQAHGRLDVMVNNAGYGLFARVHETSTADMRAIFEANYFGVFFGCKAAAAVMIRQGGGHIFNVSSVIGKRGTPFHGAYCATKFAIVGLSDSMRVELAPYGVRVTTVCPALTETEFFQHSRRGQSAGRSFRRFNSVTPATVVARKIVSAIGRNRPEIVLTAGGKFLALVAALSPGLTDLMMRVYHDDLTRRMTNDEGRMTNE